MPTATGTINPNSDAALEVSEQAEFLMNAPIADVAANFGVSIDEAVKMRVEAVKAAVPLHMDVQVRPVEPKGNLIGFASVKFNNGFVVDDFKVLQSDKGIFVGNPSKPDGKGKFWDTAHPTTKEAHAELTEAVRTAYHEAVERLQAHTAAITKADKKVPMKEQYTDAAKQAAEHNANRPAPVKDGKTKNAEH